MNIFRACLFFSLLFNTQSLISKVYKRRLNLFMKKNKNSDVQLYVPKNQNQQEYVNYLNNNNNKILISSGPAGCGKTLFVCQKAMVDFKSEKIRKIIITRPVVCVDEELGFLPGSIVKKMDPWTKPIFDTFLDFYSKSELDLLVKNEQIEICPLAFMRGRTFKNTFIIADEMQNSSPKQMKMLLTRLGDNSRIVITGDLEQTDIGIENGLWDFINKLNNWNNTSELIHQVIFNRDDIERSIAVKNVLDIYNYEKKNNTFDIFHLNETIINTISTNCTNNIIENISTSTSENNNSTKTFDLTDIRKNLNDDAALIPLHHMTKTQDIFPNYHEY